MKRIVFFILLITSALHATGQNLEYAKQVVEKLSSPEFSGRGYADKGINLAAEYIKKQFVGMGVKPFNKDYYQPFQITVNTFPSTMKLQIDGTELIPGEEYLIAPSSPSLKGEYAVYVIDKQDLLDDDRVKACVESASGKVLIIDERNFNVDDKEKVQKADESIKFLRSDAQVPTVATIVFSKDRPIWHIARRQSSKPVFIVHKQLDVKNIKKVKFDVKAKLVDYQTRNVIGYIEGKEKPDSFLVILAHYDHLGKMGAKTYFPGANDNATGIAMMLNMAKYYTANPPNYSMAFMALSAEEVGIVGARYYTEHPFFALDKIKFLVNFDMAGTGDEGIKVVNGSVYQDKFDLLTKINNDNGYVKTVETRGEACNSDHCPFHEKGVQGFFIYTMGGTQAYHDIYDRYELLPFTAFDNYAKLMIKFFDDLMDHR